MRMVRVLALAVGCLLLEARAKRHLEANIVNVDASHVHGTNSDVQTIVIPGNNSDVQKIVVINGITGDTWTTVDAAKVTTVGQLKSQVRKNLKAPEPLVVGAEPLVLGAFDKLDLTMPDLQPPRVLTDNEVLSVLFAEQSLQHNAEVVVQLIRTRMVFVKVLNLDTHHYLRLKTLPTTMTVGDLKHLVEEKDTAVDFKKDALYFDGNILEDEQAALQEFIPTQARRVEFTLMDTTGGVVFVTVVNAGSSDAQLLSLPRVPTTLTVRELKDLTLTVKPAIDYAFDDLFLNGRVLEDGQVLKDVIQEGVRRVEVTLDDKP